MRTWRRRIGHRRGVPMTVVVSVLERDGYQCAYGPEGCGGHWTADHVIPRSLAEKHELLIGYSSNHPMNLVACCWWHNERKGRRLLIPESHTHRLDEYNALGFGTFRVWDGSFEALREVVR